MKLSKIILRLTDKSLIFTNVLHVFLMWRAMKEEKKGILQLIEYGSQIWRESCVLSWENTSHLYIEVQIWGFFLMKPKRESTLNI